MVQTKLVLPVYTTFMTAITHLFLAKSVGNITGTRKVHMDHKKASPEKKFMSDHNQHKGAPTLMLHQPGTVILSFLLKGEPPDAPCITKSPPHQGKTLASQKRMKANLLSLGADYIVSRSKHFQERGYDVDIQTTQYQDDGRIKPAAEPKLIQTGCTTPIRPDKDIYLVFEEYRLNHEDSRHKTTWGSFTAQLQNTTKKNHPKSYYHEEVMEVTSQQFSNASDKDLRSLNEVYRPDQRDLSNESNCFGFSVHNRRPENWNQTEIHSGLKVIQLINRRILHLPYLEAHGFSCLQTKLWRPGDTSKRSRDTSNHPEDSSIILPCTSTQGIRRILLNSYFPFLAAFTLGALNHQRLFPYLSCCVLKLLLCFQNVPRYRTFLPKLSRYKQQHFPYSGRFFIQLANGSML